MAFNVVNSLPTPGDTPGSMEADIAPSPLSHANHSTSWTPVDGMTPISTNPSRKRSRDETAFEAIDAEHSYFPSAQQVNAPEPIPEEPIYGEGMVLLNPHTGHALSAESQTGTWYEEKADEEELRQQWNMPSEDTFRPQMPLSRKSVRLSQSSIRAAQEAVSNSNNGSAPASPPKSAVRHPEVDEATLALGIGWTQMASEDPDLQAAARGWARYLENHYSRHIHGAEILLKNRGLDAYLVGCQEGFFLFTEDLLRGQLVGRTWENCLNNLRSQPIMFESNEVLMAERTPGPESTATAELDKQQEETARISNWSDWNNIVRQQEAVAGQEVVNGLPNGHATATVAGGMDLD